MNSHRVTIVRAIALVSLLFVPMLASATAQKDLEACTSIKESTKRLECYDNAAQQSADKVTERDDNCKESVLDRLGGSFFRSFPRQRQLW